MLVRSKRDELHSKATSADLGPGSYDPVLPSYKPKAGMAPFSSTTERQTGMTSAFKTPGPGSYETAVVGGKVSTSGAAGTSSFLSHLPRTGFIPASETPGPGTYSGQIVKDPPSRSASASTSKKNGHDITWVKVATAPSIPAQGQNHGYEEGPAGELVQCPPPILGHAGTPLDQPGPGEYDPHVGAIKGNPRGTKFTGAGNRSDPVPKELRSVPGPGTYNAQQSGTGIAFKGGVAALKTQSMFASNSNRSPLGGSGRDAPGPGAYKPPSTFVSLREHLAAHPESFHAFGSSGKQSHMERNEEGVPGPGSYQLGRVQGGHNKPLPLSSFSSGTTRFAEKVQNTPGPGGYETKAVTLTENLKTKLHGRFGVFGCTSARFQQQGSSSTASPGSYNPPLDINPSELRRKDKRTSAFRSSAPRGSVVKAPSKDAAPQQYYNIEMPWSKGFISALPKAPRFAAPASEAVPGPGHYVAKSDFDVAALPPGKSGFSSGPRFGAWRTSPGPGPGAYNTAPTMIKKTFNITIGDSWE